MDTVFFDTETINLSMKSPETGNYLTANVYTLEGVTNVDGSLREMSIGQLVMAVCLKRATEVESDIVALMEEMAENTDSLDEYSTVESAIADWQSSNPNSSLTKDTATSVSTNLAKVFDTSYLSTIGCDSTIISAASSGTLTSDQLTTIMENIETQMDSLNTVNQKQLIEMQSLTSKRDDTYSLISNVLKSLYTVLTGNANNL